VALAGLGPALACGEKAAAPPASAANVASCEALVPRWIERLRAAPDVTSTTRSRADLPVASLAGVVGEGPWVEVRPDALSLDGEPLAGATEAQRLAALQSRLGLGPDGEELPPPAHQRPPLYLSLAAQTDVRTVRSYLRAIPRSFDVQLVFQAPPTDAAASPAPELQHLAAEPDPAARKALARAAYGRATSCEPMLDAVASVTATEPAARWVGLRSALVETLPACDCRDVDAHAMRDLLLLERRGGAVALGALALDFLRDERCGASLGLTPIQNVVQDIQAFDEKYSTAQQGDELVFESVLTEPKLVEYICQALPGETLAALSRERRTFFWRLPGSQQCQAWRLEPREPGSPMGIWRQQAAQGAQPLAVHYVQGAEEIRLSGPVTAERAEAGSEQSWACTQDFHMRGVDQNSIELEVGRWYFDAAACEGASPEAAEFPGCISALASQSENAVH
jgi:hypothetical protein